MKTFWETISENMADRENWRDALDRMAAEAAAENERKALAAGREELKKRQIAIVRSKLKEEFSCPLTHNSFSWASDLRA